MTPSVHAPGRLTMVLAGGAAAPVPATVSDPELGWRYVAPLPEKRSGHAAVAVGGKVYVFGGGFGATLYDAIRIYDPEANTWTSGATMPTARARHRAVAVGTTVYVMGGVNSTGADLASVEAYNAETGAWTMGLASMATARREFAAFAIGTTVYVAGGENGPGTGPTRLATVEAYNTATNTWVARASLAEARASLSAAVVGGQVYVAGGTPVLGQDSTRVERYDPAADVWTTVGNLPVAQRDLELVVVRGVVYGGGVCGRLGFGAGDVDARQRGRERVGGPDAHADGARRSRRGGGE